MELTDTFPMELLKRHDQMSSPKVAVEMKKLTSSWSNSQKSATLNSVSACFDKNKLNAIIGPVGSGKVKEMPLKIMNFHYFSCRHRYFMQYWGKCQQILDLLTYLDQLVMLLKIHGSFLDQ